MIRDPDLVLAEHHQRHPHTEGASLVEMMLKLLEVDVPDLQHLGDSSANNCNQLIDHVFGRFALRRFEGEQAAFQALLKSELTAGRPVGFVLNHQAAPSGPEARRGWLAIRIHEISQYFFIDLVSKVPETGAGEGHFTEKRALRLDKMTNHAVSEVLYCEELFPGPPRIRLGRRPAPLRVTQAELT